MVLSRDTRGQTSSIGQKRPRSHSHSPSRQSQKEQRKNVFQPHQEGPEVRRYGNEGANSAKKQESFAQERTRLNQLQEAEQMRQWVSQEDAFVLKQAKKKAEIRVKEGRARPIDWLSVTLRVIDPYRNQLDDEIDDAELDVVDPDGVFEGLSEAQLFELEKDIDVYIALETNSSNLDFWNTMKVICRDRGQKYQALAPEGRVVSSVAADIDCLLAPKSFEELEGLERQITSKLSSNEPIDVDYWEQLLRSLIVWKARAKLRKVYQSVIDSRLESLRKQQMDEATIIRSKLQIIFGASNLSLETDIPDPASLTPLPAKHGFPSIKYPTDLDPEPLLKLRAEDKSLEQVDEKAFLQGVMADRTKILKLAFVPTKQRATDNGSVSTTTKALELLVPEISRFAAMPNEDFSQATKALYEREVARGVGENEEIFAGEEDVSSMSKPPWSHKHRPRKPRYFNRVQMGYEWNKYNQTHYDHDNPPPKVVQGYKFNIFYPDLIDGAKAPVYRIEREHGRKKGESFAPAGEEDTCLIRFVAGPPYEDIAFRIVDKEWDYSSKRERGFRSSFDKGILQLHFQFKKVRNTASCHCGKHLLIARQIYYRK
ncbi:MAG: hypothetical protein M1829_003439 [Trizodia sp. TS-e1964]|nr:MAG: hypothetical protein M1829_003439 [Trizodia sp. TS-e1964]